MFGACRPKQNGLVSFCSFLVRIEAAEAGQSLGSASLVSQSSSVFLSLFSMDAFVEVHVSMSNPNFLIFLSLPNF